MLEGQTEVASNASIVLLGTFNPLIFQPQWLRDHALIGEDEESAALEKLAASQLLHPQLAQLNMGWLEVVVTLDRVAVTVKEEPFVRVQDFVSGCFRLLSHTPVHAMGINRVSVFRAASESAWHRLGDVLGPKDPWSELLTVSGNPQPVGRLGGLRLIVMERSTRPDERPGFIRVKVEAVDDAESQGASLKTLVEVNDHFLLRKADGRYSSAAEAVDLLNLVWDQSNRRSEHLISKVQELCNDD